MKQSGTYHIYKVENNIRVISPIANAYLYFIQNDAIKLTAKTDAKGKFNFDLPLGSYIVGSASEGGIEQILANGSKFTLDASSKLDAFEKWINAPSADVDSELLKRFRELAKQSQDAADEAQKILNQMNAGSIGSGKWLKEGAYGVGGNIRISFLNAGANTKPQFFADRGENLPQAWRRVDTAYIGGVILQRDSRPTAILNGNSDNIYISRHNGTDWTTAIKLLNDSNTFADKNGVIFNMPPTHKDTLLVGDFGVGRTTTHPENVKITDSTGFSYYTAGTQEQGSPIGVAGPLIVHNIAARGFTFAARGRQVAMQTFGEAGDPIFDFYHTANTTVDSNGFIKKASPIIKLFDDRIEANDQFYDEPIFEKIGTGTYKISNTKGLSKDGWTYEKPRGGDGTPYFRIEVSKLEDGCIISVHDEYDSLEEATITDIDGNTRTINKVVKVLGEARDIKPNERWIDLRFEEDHERIAQEEEEARIQMEKEELERAEEEAKRLAEEEAENALKLEEERNLERELME